MAAPPINPTIAACDRKSTRKPSLRFMIMLNTLFLEKPIEFLGICYHIILINHLNNPNSAWKIPVKKVTVKTILLYAVGSVVGSTTFEIVADKRSETTATGPIAISLELPIKAYIRGGTTLVSEIKE